MPLVKENILASDPWYHASDDTPLLPDVPATVSLARWNAEREDILRSGMDIGIRLEPADDVNSIRADLEHFGLVEINFPAFGDGRGYSQARLIRDRFGFTGEIRATGDVLHDQLQMMHRSGFDAYDVKKDVDVERFIDALNEMSFFYQSANGRGLSLRELRKAANMEVAAAE